MFASPKQIYIQHREKKKNGGGRGWERGGREVWTQHIREKEKEQSGVVLVNQSVPPLSLAETP